MDDTLGVNAINIDNKVGRGFNLVRPMPLMLVVMVFQCSFVWVIFHCRGGGGCGIDVLPHAACLVVSLVAVGDFCFLFGCAQAGQALGSVVILAFGLIAGVRFHVLLGP